MIVVITCIGNEVLRLFYKIDYRIGNNSIKVFVSFKMGGGEDKKGNFINFFIVYIQNI